MKNVRKFSVGFKEAFVTKVMNRGDRSISEICKQEGVGLSSASRWLLERDSGSGMKKENSTQGWTPEAKLKAIFESSGLSEEELGLFLRREGLHSYQLEEWRAEILKALGTQKAKSVKDDRDQKIRELEQDLRRKDKALAEASALLILQKKVNLIWGNQSEGEK